MKLLDVNVLVYAHHAEAAEHQAYAAWLTALIESGAPFGVSDLVLSGVVRVVTHPRIYKPPSPLDATLAFIENLRQQPNFVQAMPGPRHWGIFEQLLRATNAWGNLVPDAYHAALALELGADWISTDKDFARFPGLKWQHPLRGT